MGCSTIHAAAHRGALCNFTQAEALAAASRIRSPMRARSSWRKRPDGPGSSCSTATHPWSRSRGAGAPGENDDARAEAAEYRPAASGQRPAASQWPQAPGCARRDRGPWGRGRSGLRRTRWAASASCAASTRPLATGHVLVTGASTASPAPCATTPSGGGEGRAGGAVRRSVLVSARLAPLLGRFALPVGSSRSLSASSRPDLGHSARGRATLREVDHGQRDRIGRLVEERRPATANSSSRNLLSTVFERHEYARSSNSDCRTYLRAI